MIGLRPVPRAIAAPKEDSVADEGAAREQPNPALPKTMSLSGLAPARVSPPEDRDTYSVTALADITDRSLHAAVARFNGGVTTSGTNARAPRLMHINGTTGNPCRMCPDLRAIKVSPWPCQWVLRRSMRRRSSDNFPVLPIRSCTSRQRGDGADAGGGAGGLASFRDRGAC